MKSDSTESVGEDHGQIVAAPRVHRIWAWIFPALAAGAGLWLLWSNWTSKGPEIVVHFTEAPGIQSGKTVLIYRGVTSGQVTGVTLNKAMDGVSVVIRLKAFAANLASEGTEFWIDQPVISLKETTGLESIIQGNSIQARVGNGPRMLTFTGTDRAPLAPLDAPSLVLNLRAGSIPFLARGTPVYHRGVSVGVVRDKTIGELGKPFLQVIIDKEDAHLVLDTSRFWVLPATSLRLSARGASLDIAGLAALVEGGIAFDHFKPGGKPVSGHADFELAPNEFAARADGPPFQIIFENGQGLVAGETRIFYLGQPVGFVESVIANPDQNRIEVVARMEDRFSSHLTAESIFTLIKPRISLRGVSGLDTLVTGPVIAFTPGAGEPSREFVGRLGEQHSTEDHGRIVSLRARELPAMEDGAPVYYRGLIAGTVLEKKITDDEPILTIQIHEEFSDRLRTTTRFWRVPATSVSAGPGLIEAKVEGLAALLEGGIAFDVFGDPGDPATGDEDFQLYNSETAARAVSVPIRIAFENGRGLLAGKTALRYLGLPVGLVDSIRITNGKVEVTARVDSGYDYLRRKGTVFAIVRPEISLQGLSGVETILSGVYIDCVPGTGDITQELFLGKSTSDPAILERAGLSIRLTSKETKILVGAPVAYRDVVVGAVTEKSLSSDGTAIELTVVIDENYRSLVRTNSHFWDASGVEASLGFLKLKIQSPTLIAPDGMIAFANPPKPGDAVKPGQVFPLATKPLK